MINKIDINRDFWQKDEAVRDNKLCFYKLPKEDPDSKSSDLYEYHHKLWNREPMQGLKKMKKKLKFGDITLSADNFGALYRNKYKQLKKIEGMEQAQKSKPQLKYLIGGSLIFPRLKGGINPSRGINKSVRDRVDITLEYIRLFYEKPDYKSENQLWKSLNNPINKKFFSLFRQGKSGFKNYINFFFLNDFVTNDYKVKNLFSSPKDFENDVGVLKSEILLNTENLPKSSTEWLNLYTNLSTCIKKRTERIRDYLSEIVKKEDVDIVSKKTL